MGQVIMMIVGFGLLYLAIARKFEPLLLLPMGFGAILTNIPMARTFRSWRFLALYLSWWN